MKKQANNGHISFMEKPIAKHKIHGIGPKVYKSSYVHPESWIIPAVLHAVLSKHEKEVNKCIANYRNRRIAAT